MKNKTSNAINRILIAYPENHDWSELDEFLKLEGYQTQGAHSIEDCLHKARAWNPHLVIINESLNRLGPFDLLSRLYQSEDKKIDLFHSLMTIMIVQNTDADFVAKIVEYGADDVFAEPINLIILLAKIKSLLRHRLVFEQLHRANQKVDALTMTDSQTGLLKMNWVQEQLKGEVARSRRSKSPLSCIILDIDNFKDLIESFDHEIANSVVINTGKLISLNTREIDICGHHGGDEFILILPETTVDGAKVVAERINNAISKHKIEKQRRRTTLSACFGIAGIDHLFQEDATSLLKRAERALKAAKLKGSSQIELAD